jgi:hypothetical protein
MNDAVGDPRRESPTQHLVVVSESLRETREVVPSLLRGEHQLDRAFAISRTLSRGPEPSSSSRLTNVLVFGQIRANVDHGLVPGIARRIRIWAVDRVGVANLPVGSVDDDLAAAWTAVEMSRRGRLGLGLSRVKPGRSIRSLCFVGPLPVRALRDVSALSCHHDLLVVSNIRTWRKIRTGSDAYR